MAVRRAARAPRGEESWRLAIARARASWDELTGGPDGPRYSFENGRGLYSDDAARAILETAVALWADTAALASI